ncbi:MAG TPA: SOS response-associated peptidase [Tepidiformaceae bacterium]|nr:SOS response-associated peptidase [Tepidiformaceae bacterium]
MCGRFTMTTADASLLEQQLGLPLGSIEDAWPEFRPRYNIAPTDPHFVVRLRGEQWEPLGATWGLLNSWARDNKRAGSQINARAETLDESRVFREAFQKRRCLVPADGFFEWSGPKSARQPIWYHRPDRGLFLFAGLYDWWKPTNDANWQATFTIVTTEPNGLIRPIHDRMPVILSGEGADRWLDPRGEDPEKLKVVLRPAPEDFLSASWVSPKANSVKNDTPDVLEPVTTGF